MLTVVFVGVVFLYIRLCFLHVDERQDDETGDEIEDEGEDAVAQAAEPLVDETEDQGTGPGGAALADLVEGVELGFLAGRDHLREEAAADGLRSAHDEGDESAEDEELGDAGVALQTGIGKKNHAQPDDEADDDGLLCADPFGEPAPQEGAKESHELDHEDDDGQGGLPDFQTALNQRCDCEGGCDRDHGLDAVIVEEVGEQEFQGFREVLDLAEGLSQLLETNADVGLIFGEDMHGMARFQASPGDEGKAQPPDARGCQVDADRQFTRDAQILTEHVEREVQDEQ